MQSIELNNMLDRARNRAGAAAALVARTRAEYDLAVSKRMITTAKKLKGTLSRQETALGLANEEVREIEAALSAEGDLVSQAQKNGGKAK